MHELQTEPAMIEMVRDARATHGRDRFFCTLEEWRLLLEVARDFGWQPRGTTYELTAQSKVTVPARRDYEPGECSDRKRVDDDDANALARALSQARDSSALGTSAPRSAPEVFASLLREFAQYAFGGAFVFAHGDAASATKLMGDERLG